MFAERLASLRQDAPPNDLVAEMLAFIGAAGRRGLIRTAVHADDEDEA